MHCPVEFSRIFPPVLAEVLFRDFLIVRPERGEEERSIQQGGYLALALTPHSLLLTFSVSSMGSALDPALLFVTEGPAVTTSLQK